MIILSFNYRGFANTHKKLALKYIFLNYCPNVIMLQETLGIGNLVRNSLSKMMMGWSSMTVDATGRSGCLALGVKDSSVKLLNSWVSDLVLRAEVYSLELCSKFSLINIYGSCQHRVLIWNNLISNSFMKNPNMIVGGDLNFSLGLSEN